MAALKEAIIVLFTYGISYLMAGLIISFLIVSRGSRRARRVSRGAFLLAAILILWIAAFLGVDSGYRDWQNSPLPPEEAFSDTGGPFYALFLGWLPAAVLLGPAHVLLRKHTRKKARGRRTTESATK